jgi:hypothetical protein
MQSRKWLIEPPNELLPADRRAYWERTHTSGDIENIWSVTDDAGALQKFGDELKMLAARKRILIPGCGSKVSLQNHVADSFADIDEILCTDFDLVVKIAASQSNHPKIRYAARDSARLGFENEFDVVIDVNATLSDSDVENREILGACFGALREGGVLIGMFPTILCAVDAGYLQADRAELEQVDLERSSFYEKSQALWQIFYTPLRLRQILKEAGFHMRKMEVYFCDSEFFLRQNETIYNIADHDIVTYELLVVAEKPSIANANAPKKVGS